jgi:hypothetical protein
MGTHCSHGIYILTEENRVAECEAFETGSISATTMTTKQTVNLPIVLHRCEIWSLQVMEGHGLRPLQSKVLRKISGSKGRMGDTIRAIHLGWDWHGIKKDKDRK